MIPFGQGIKYIAHGLVLHLEYATQREGTLGFHRRKFVFRLNWEASQ